MAAAAAMWLEPLHSEVAARDPLRDLPGYARSFRALIGPRVHVVFALLLVESLLEGLGLLLLLPLLAAFGGATAGIDGFSAWLLAALATLGIQGLVPVMLAIACLVLLKGAVAFAANAFNGYLRADLQTTLLQRMFDAYSRMSYGYYASRDTGYFYNRFNQVYALVGAFQAYSSLLVGAIRSAAYVGFGLLVAWKFGLAALVAGALLSLAFRRLNASVRALSRHSAEHMGSVAGTFVQTIQAFKYLAATATIGPLRERVLASVRHGGKLEARQNFAMAFTNAAREPVAVLTIIAIVIGHALLLGEALAPILVSILLFYRGINAVLGVQSSWQSLLSQVGSLEVVRDELRQLAEIPEPAGGRQRVGLEHGIEFRKVSFAYDPRIGDVLHDLSLRIPARRTVALVGASGAGKSTVIDLLTLLLAPRQGELVIDGIPADQLDRAAWRARIGYVMQEAVIFDDSVANNICLWAGDLDADPALEARIREAARAAHLLEFIDSLPDGLRTVVGDRGIRLSGGQRQRLFIARELYKQPQLLILDEATSSLDSEAERAIQQSLDELHGRLTVVVIAHRLATVRSADEVLVFDHGRLVEQGSYAELRERPQGRFAAMVAAQTL